MAQGLGAFTEGLQGGIKARSDMDAKKQYTRYMTDKNDENDREWANRQATDKSAYIKEFGSEEGYSPAKRTKIQDPALMRLGKFVGGKLKGFFGGGSGGEEANALEGASFATPEIAPAIPAPQNAVPVQQSAIPGQQGPMEQPFADGGLVKGYANGGEVEDEDDEPRRYHGGPMSQDMMTPGASADEPMFTSGGDVAGVPEQLPKMTAGLDAAATGMDAAKHDYATATGPRGRGGAITDYISNTVMGVAEGARGLATDVLVDNDLVQTGLGMLGFEGDEGAPATQGVPTPEAQTGSPAEAAVTAIDAPDTSAKEMADQAMSEGEQLALENLDYQLLADQGVSPDDLPSMNTSDWAEHRYNVFRSEMDRSGNVKEAYEAMDSATVDIQMKGMMRDMDKAVHYLQGGLNEAAALALRQSYQYFPNGSDVKFGTAVDPKTGMPAIITVGFDEETGEQKGDPMLITVDRLTTMRENFSKPEAFRAWTKDHQDLQMEIDKLQSQDDYRQGSLENQSYRDETARMRVENAGIPGLKATDVDRRAGIYGDRLGMIAMDDPRVADHLERAMAEYARLSGGDTSEAKDVIMGEFESGGGLEGQGIQAVDAFMSGTG